MCWGGVQFETGGPVPYLNILGGTSQKNHPVGGVLQPRRGSLQPKRNIKAKKRFITTKEKYYSQEEVYYTQKQMYCCFTREFEILINDIVLKI